VIIARQPNWENQLQAYLDASRDTNATCAEFVAGAVEAETGVDVRSRFRGRMSWVRDNLAEAVSELFEERLPVAARTGDVVMVGGSLGIVSGGVGLFVAEHEGATGLAVLPMATWEKAWTVG
jgi:hypothetical protein